MQLSPLARFWRLINQYKKKIRLIYYYAIFSGLVNLSLPLGIQAIISYLQTGELTTSWIVLVAFVLVGISISGIIQISQLRIVEDIQQDIFTKSAFEFVYRIPKIKQLSLDNYHAPEMVNRFFDVLTIQKGLPKILIDFSLAAFQIIFGLVLLTIYSPFFIILGLTLILIIYLIFKTTGPEGLDTSIKESKYKYSLAHWIEEIAGSNKTFKVYNQSNLHMDKADGITVNYLSYREKHFRLLLKQFKLFVGFKVWVAAGLLVLGGFLVLNQQMNIGQFVASEIIIILIINSVEKLIRILETIYDVLTALDKIGFVTDLELDEETGEADIKVENGLDISAKNMHFKYPRSEANALIDISFDIPFQSRVLLTGKSGHGKSTLLNILARILDINSGDLIFNKRNAKYYKREDFKKYVGLVSPTSKLFEATIEDNILLNRNIKREDFRAIIDTLNLRSYINQLENGVKTMVDSGGRRMPRSVIQKIILARTLIHKPKLLLLEDPLQFIDEDEKDEIINYIMSSERDWTVVVVADYGYWKKMCNQIIEL